MEREEQIYLEAEKEIDEFDSYGYQRSPREIWAQGAEWADANPKESNNSCCLCNQLCGVNHKSDECYLTYDGETLYVDVDIPLSYEVAKRCYGFDINYCPMCGRKLSE